MEALVLERKGKSVVIGDTILVDHRTPLLSLRELYIDDTVVRWYHFPIRDHLSVTIANQSATIGMNDTQVGDVSWAEFVSTVPYINRFWYTLRSLMIQVAFFNKHQLYSRNFNLFHRPQSFSGLEVFLHRSPDIRKLRTSFLPNHHRTWYLR
jgi:hypothetical protein